MGITSRRIRFLSCRQRMLVFVPHLPWRKKVWQNKVPQSGARNVLISFQVSVVFCISEVVLPSEAVLFFSREALWMCAETLQLSIFSLAYMWHGLAVASVAVKALPGLFENVSPGRICETDWHSALA